MLDRRLAPSFGHRLDPHPKDLVVARPEGLYCPPGGFYIDPWQPVAHALITHAHGDHLRMGHGRYLNRRRRGGMS